MAVQVQVTLKQDESREEVSELILISMNGNVWIKRYHGHIFLLFDVQELGLIDEHSLEQEATGRRAALLREALVDEAVLKKLRFTMCEVGEVSEDPKHSRA